MPLMQQGIIYVLVDSLAHYLTFYHMLAWLHVTHVLTPLMRPHVATD
jgi:hypothetical protein